MDKRVKLTEGYEIKKDDYIIKVKRLIGQGGSCLVYEAEQICFVSEKEIKKQIVLKEFYPEQSYKESFSIERSSDMRLVPNNSELFERLKRRFLGGQIKYQEYYVEYMDNVLPVPSIPIEINNTIYVYSDIWKGEELTNYSPSSLNDILCIMASACNAIGVINKKEMLYLDCKPSNFFIYRVGGEEKVYLFDFDTVENIYNIRSGNSDFYSYSKGWAAPEQEREEYSQIGYHSDAFSLGLIFLWLLTKYIGVELKDAKIETLKEERFWNELKSKTSEAVVWKIKDILDRTLEEDTDERRNYFCENDSVLKLSEGFKRLIDLNKEKPIKKVAIIEEIASNRFLYNSHSTSFLGREDEFEYLKRMCESSDRFNMIGICGDGGSGKTRLAYEICSYYKEKRDWRVFSPSHIKSNIETIKSELSGLKEENQSFLICFDDISVNLGEINEFITLCIETEVPKGTKIRLIIIDREIDIQRIDYSYVYPECESFTTEEGLIRIKEMSEDKLKGIMDTFAAEIYKKAISDDEWEKIWGSLSKVDDKKRPLYMLFIGDAVCNGEDVRNWDKHDAIEMITKREYKKAFGVIELVYSNEPQKEKAFEAFKFILVVVSFVNQIKIDKLEEILKPHFGIQDINGFYWLLEKLKMLNKGIVKTIYPDILNEFICYKFIEKNSESFQTILNITFSEDEESTFFFAYNLRDSISNNGEQLIVLDNFLKLFFEELDRFVFYILEHDCDDTDILKEFSYCVSSNLALKNRRYIFLTKYFSNNDIEWLFSCAISLVKEKIKSGVNLMEYKIGQWTRRVSVPIKTSEGLEINVETELNYLPVGYIQDTECEYRGFKGNTNEGMPSEGIFTREDGTVFSGKMKYETVTIEINDKTIKIPSSKGKIERGKIEFTDGVVFYAEELIEDKYYKGRLERKETTYEGLFDMTLSFLEGTVKTPYGVLEVKTVNDYWVGEFIWKDGETFKGKFDLNGCLTFLEGVADLGDRKFVGKYRDESYFGTIEQNNGTVLEGKFNGTTFDFIEGSILFPDEVLFEGEKKNEKYYGILKTPYGDFSDGEFDEDFILLEGKIHFSDGNEGFLKGKEYEGRYDCGNGFIFEGKMLMEKLENGDSGIQMIEGKEIQPDGTIIIGKFIDEWIEGEVCYPDGSRYVGKLLNGRHEGDGTLYYPDNTFVKGIWEKGVLNGEGEYSGPYGHAFGVFKNNNMVKGTFVFENGEVFEGDFEEGGIPGKGVLKTEDGERKVNGIIISGKEDDDIIFSFDFAD